MGWFALLLVLVLLAGVVAMTWKRLLALLLSRVVQSGRLRLSVAAVSLRGVTDLRLTLRKASSGCPAVSCCSSCRHAPECSRVLITQLGFCLTQGPVREVRVGRLQLGRAGPIRAQLAAFLQSFFAGTPQLPVLVQDVIIVLGPAPPAPKPGSAARSDGAADSSPAPGWPSGGGGAGTRPAPRLPRRLPLGLLQLVPVAIERLTVVDSTRGVALTLEGLAASLAAQQQSLSLQSLALCLATEAPASAPAPAPEALTAGSPGPGSPSRRRVAAAVAVAAAPAPQLAPPFFTLRALSLTHEHDASFSLASLAQRGGRGATAPASGAEDGLRLQRLLVEVGPAALALTPELAAAADSMLAQRKTATALRKLERLEQQQQQEGEPAPGNSAVGQQLEQQQPPAQPMRAAVAGRRLLLALPRELELSAAGMSVHMAGAWGLEASGELAALQAQLVQPTKPSHVLHAPAPLPESPTLRLQQQQQHDQHAGTEPQQPEPQATVAVTWQRLSWALGAAGGGDQPALALRCAAAELSLQLLGADLTMAAASDGLQPPWKATTALHISAMHTSVRHGALPALVQQAGALVASHRAPGEERRQQQTGEQQQQERAAKVASGPAHAAKPPGLLAEWRCRLELGDGSSLNFLDQGGASVWTSSIRSASLSLGQARQSSAATAGGVDGEAASGSGGGAGLSASFEAGHIEMHASAAEPAVAARQPLQQVLRAQLLRMALGEDGRGEAAAAGVHALAQQAALATIASVIGQLLPARVAAAALAPAGKPSRRPRRLSSLSLSLTDTMLALPTTVVVPADQSPSGQLALVHATAALLLEGATCRVQLGGSGGGLEAGAQDLALLYCEGLNAQRFPASSTAMRGEDGDGHGLPRPRQAASPCSPGLHVSRFTC